MNVLLVGFGTQEEAAIEIMLGMAWPDSKPLTLARTPDLSVPVQSREAKACQFCIVDLLGLGVRSYSRQALERLESVLIGRSAVLLNRQSSGEWLKHVVGNPFQNIQWVQHPYTGAEMRAAVQRVRDAFSRDRTVQRIAEPKRSVADLAAERKARTLRGAPLVAPQPAIRPTPAPVPAAVPRNPFADTAPAPQGPEPASAARRRLPMRHEAPAPPVTDYHDGDMPTRRHSGYMAPDGAIGTELRDGGLLLVLAAYPRLADLPLIKLLRPLALQTEAVVWTVHGLPRAVIHPVEGWIASSLSVTALVSLLDKPALLDECEAGPLPPEAIDSTLASLSPNGVAPPKTSLADSMWELVHSIALRVQPTVQADLRFQLRHMPNLTRLRGATAPDLQLSAICLHLPKSATELHRAFPKLSPVQIHAFALACVLSGKALSFPVALSRAGASTAPAAPAPELPKPKPLPPARKGFLRAFLDKLL